MIPSNVLSQSTNTQLGISPPLPLRNTSNLDNVLFHSQSAATNAGGVASDGTSNALTMHPNPGKMKVILHNRDGQPVKIDCSYNSAILSKLKEQNREKSTSALQVKLVPSSRLSKKHERVPTPRNQQNQRKKKANVVRRATSYGGPSNDPGRGGPAIFPSKQHITSVSHIQSAANTNRASNNIGKRSTANTRSKSNDPLGRPTLLRPWI